MAFTIDQEQCAACGVCESACTKGAISLSGDKYLIDASKCTDCGDCTDSCPLTCINGVKK